MTSHRDDVKILHHHDVTSLLFCIVIIILSYEKILRHHDVTSLAKSI